MLLYADKLLIYTSNTHVNFYTDQLNSALYLIANLLDNLSFTLLLSKIKQMVFNWRRKDKPIDLNYKES